MKMHWNSLVPPEARSEASRVVISGREQVLIEQHRGLFSYETSRIRVRTQAGLMTVAGTGLVISHFGPQDLLIQGEIASVALEKEAL